MSWARFERRWLASMVEAVVPPLAATDGSAGVPASTGLDDGIGKLLVGMPSLQKLALRFAVWLLAWVGPLFIGRLPTFRRLSPDARDRVLVRMGGSDNYLVREMVVLLKLVAGLVLELDPAFGKALGWGEGETVRIREIEGVQP